MKRRIYSVSGGKDSTACILHGLERGLSGRYIFADTGNEHELTHEYLEYLESELNIKIERIRADFTKRLATRRTNLENTESTVHKDWVLAGWKTKDILELAALIEPTGNPFLDLCMLKGRFPSTKAAFCTIELKQVPMQSQICAPLLDDERNIIISVQGVRRDESRARAFRDPCARMGERQYYQYPIYQWTAEDVFALHHKHGIEPNPLYKMGCGRVGCMPCINVRKDELNNISHRFPDHIDRIREWERILARTSRRGASTFLPTIGIGTDEAVEKGNIYKQVEWAKTSRGARNIDWIRAEAPPACSSIYGLCE